MSTADLITENARLKNENEILRDALDFYAQSSNWRREVTNLGPRRKWIKARAAFDRGAKAKFVLMTIGSRGAA